MKAVLCVFVAVAGTLVLSVVKQDIGSVPPSHSGKNLDTSNFMKADDLYCLIAPASPYVNYQAYHSYDQENWVPHGSPVRGHRAFNIVTLNAELVANTRPVYIKFETL